MSLEVLRNRVLRIEAEYTEDAMIQAREWEKRTKREQVVEAIANAETVEELAQQMLVLEAGLSMPFSLRPKKPIDVDDEHNDEGDAEYKDLHRIKIQFMKFWPNQSLKQAWKHYLGESMSLQALYVCVHMLETVLEQFIVRQREAAQKKQVKEQKAKGVY